MKGFTLWFTGLPCSGKTTLAKNVEEILLERGLNVELFDGDEIRTNLTKGLGFSKEDRDTNIRRVGYVCNLLTRNGVVAIAAVISPYDSIREEVRATIGRFIMIYLDAPLEELIKRDVKGMYKKALAGEIKNFTGIDDPYEVPEKPEVHINTSRRDSRGEHPQDHSHPRAARSHPVAGRRPRLQRRGGRRDQDAPSGPGLHLERQ